MPLRRYAFAVTMAAAVLTAAGAAAQEQQNAFEAIGWTDGPATGKLGSVAEIAIPEGYAFTGAQGARKFMDLTQNPSDGSELGIILPRADDQQWFVIFEFSEVGYIKDDDRDKLDADALLKSIRKGTESANEVRKSKGWPTMEILGWNKPPFYDTRTNNLTWAIRGRSTDQKPDEVTVNHSTRLLGRSGYLSANLVLDQQEVGRAMPSFQNLIAGVSYLPGNKYAEFRQGDKVAAYGLTALVAGGAGAALAKSGLLAKFWKVIVGAVVALGAGIRGLWKRFAGERPA